MKKKVAVTLLCLAIGTSLAGCGETKEGDKAATNTDTETAQETDDGEVYELKMSYTIAGTETIAEVAQEMAKSIEEKTDGQLILQNYPNGELASDVDALELAASGSNVLAFGTPDFLASYVPDLGVLDGPYLFSNPEEFAVLEGSDWFAQVSEDLESKGIKNLSMGWYFGPRHVIHNTGKEIKTPEDLNGVRLRSASSPMRVAMLEAMGASVTQMNWNEVYSAMNQGVMDGCEAPLSTMYNSKLYEVCSDISLTGHIEAIWSVNMSSSFFDSLPEEYQKILQEEVTAFAAKSIEAVQADQEDWQKTLEDEGVRFTEVDKDAFREATKSAYDKVTDLSPGLYDTIQGIIAQ